jgi:hypothetical protein
MSYKVCLKGGVDDMLITDEKALHVQVANERKRKKSVCSKVRDDFIGGQLK